MISFALSALVFVVAAYVVERRLSRSQRALVRRMDARSEAMYKQSKVLTRELQRQKKTADRILVESYEMKKQVEIVLLDPKVQRVLNRHEGV